MALCPSGSVYHNKPYYLVTTAWRSSWLLKWKLLRPVLHCVIRKCVFSKNGSKFNFIPDFGQRKKLAAARRSSQHVASFVRQRWKFGVINWRPSSVELSWQLLATVDVSSDNPRYFVTLSVHLCVQHSAHEAVRRAGPPACDSQYLFEMLDFILWKFFLFPTFPIFRTVAPHFCNQWKSNFLSYFILTWRQHKTYAKYTRQK